METFEYGGFLWPIINPDENPTNPRAPRFILKEAGYIDQILEHVDGRRLVFQAGGNVGVFPFRLADRFRHVVTCEAADDNFELLQRNAGHLKNIQAHKAAIGPNIGTIGLHRHRKNCGAHQTRGPGNIPMISIDSLELKDCNLIWLDIEGMELEALRGGSRTIERFNPVIAIEEVGLGEPATPHLLTLGYKVMLEYRFVKLFKRDDKLRGVPYRP